MRPNPVTGIARCMQGHQTPRIGGVARETRFDINFSKISQNGDKEMLDHKKASNQMYNA